MRSLMEKCRLCPRECGADRLHGEKGFCGAEAVAKIARAALHFWEEPCISGKNGSGTVFFSHCTLKCVFCQNYEISSFGRGEEKSAEELADIFIRLEDEGANNINLVTPTHYVVPVMEAVADAKKRGLNIPVIYNCGGYEKAETIKMLEGLIDIYMPDMKYFNDKYAVKYSSAPGYFEHAKKALSEMTRQQPKAEFNGEGIMQKGVIVRHLMLPGLLFDTKKIIDYLYKTYGDNIYISLMNQYTPVKYLKGFPELERTLPERAYDDMIDYCVGMGVKNAFVQEQGTAKEAFIPEFYGEI